MATASFGGGPPAIGAGARFAWAAAERPFGVFLRRHPTPHASCAPARAEKRERRGGFLVDFFNFERTTAVSGWRLDALIVVRSDVVLFRSFGGEPDNLWFEHQRNPLWPLQSVGDEVLGAAIR